MDARTPQLSPHDIASGWLGRLRTTLAETEPRLSLVRLLLPDCHLRDQLLLSWDLRTLHGPDAIAAYVNEGLVPGSGALGAGGLNNVILDERPALAPECLPGPDQPGAVRFAWTFESARARCRGTARLFAPSENTPADGWRAGTVFLMVDAIKGHEELGHERGLHSEGGVHLPWLQVKRERHAKVEQDPYVLVVGAGQAGLQVTARLQQLGVPTLLIERHGRVGDDWRARYDSLSLHTPREQHALLYMPYPEKWPTYTPKDKLSDWYEAYANMQDLVVWTGTRLATDPDSRPTYHTATGRWTLSVVRNGERITLKPAHVVLATGTLGVPHIPTIPNADVFRGPILHSSAFKNGAPFGRQRVLVVGSGNSAVDICGDLVGAQSQVTLLQRAPTTVLLRGMANAYYNLHYPEGLLTEVADFKLLAISPGFRVARARQARAALVAAGLDPDCANEDDARRKAALIARGFLVSDGPDKGGFAAQFTQSFARYFLDKGFSDLVMADKVKIKSGAGLAHFTPGGVVLEDGTALDADAVIFATGYEDARVGWRAIFGDEIIERAGPAWGLDAEGEVIGQYRPTGQPGLWFVGGGFESGRWGSKNLGLLIQAEHLGMWKQ